MEQKRVNIVDNQGIVEVTNTRVEKTVHSEKSLLVRKAYFEQMIAKGQDGLAKVEALLSDIANAKKR